MCVSFIHLTNINGGSILTSSLEHKVNLSREVLSMEVVLAGSVEVELGEVVRDTANGGRAVGVDLDGGAQVLKLSTAGVRVDGQAEGGAANGGLATVDVDRGLVGANGAELVEGVQAVPVEGTLELVEAERTLGALGQASRTRAEGGAVVADGSSQGGEGGNGEGLHGDGRQYKTR